MSDKFVVGTNEIGEIIVTDAETGNVYHYGSMSNFLGLIRLMNEQQARIKELEKTKERWIEKTDKLEQYIDSLFFGNTHICKHLDVEMAKFWCDKEQKYHLPQCKYKDCFKKENLVKTADEVLRSVE